MPNVLLLAWRQGRKRRRNVYAQLTPDSSRDDDIDVAKFDSAVVAEHAVRLHNLSLQDCT